MIRCGTSSPAFQSSGRRSIGIRAPSGAQLTPADVPGFFGRLNLGMTAAFATSYDTVLDELQEIRPTYFGGVPRMMPYSEVIRC